MDTTGLIGVMETDGVAKLVRDSKQLLAGWQAVVVGVDLHTHTGASVRSRQVSPGYPAGTFKAHEHPGIHTGGAADDRHAQAGTLQRIPVFYGALYSCSPGTRDIRLNIDPYIVVVGIAHNVSVSPLFGLRTGSAIFFPLGYTIL